MGFSRMFRDDFAQPDLQRRFTTPSIAGADLAAVKALDPGVVEEFGRYGLANDRGRK